MSNLFHFDFQHLGEKNNGELFLKVRGQKIPLELHTEQSLRAARGENKVLGLLHNNGIQPLTHFAQLNSELLVKNRLTMVEVVGHQTDNGLPPLHFVKYLVHPDDLRKYAARLAKKSGPKKFSSLQYYGLESHPQEDIVGHMMDQYYLLGPLDIAKHLAGQHPLLLSDKPQTHLAMENEHIYPILSTDPDALEQLRNLQFLTQAITDQGQDSWAKVEQATDGEGKKMYYEIAFGEGEVGDPVMVYDFSEETAEALAPAAAKPVQTSRNDQQFKNQTWSVNQGESAHDIANQDVKAPPRLKQTASLLEKSPGGKWSVTPNTSSYGFSANQGSISFDDKNNFSIEVHNNFLRIAGAYIEFYSDMEMKKPMKNPMSKDMVSWFQSETKTYLSSVGAVNTIMGIPMPTDPTQLKALWPAEAQAAKLMFGSAGTWNYDKNVVWPGFIQTGIFCFGIPLFMMAATSAVTDTKWYKTFIEDKDLVLAAIAVAAPAGVAAFAVDVAAVEGLKKSLARFGGILAGILVKKGFEKLAAVIMAKVAASQIAQAVPYIGWALKVASVALSASQMAVSMVEILASPAVVEVGIKREMTFKFKLAPDPKHGEPGKPEKAIWPAVGDNYKIMVNYKNGTGFEAKGLVPLTEQGGSSNIPIEENFTVPWGGQMQVIAAVYSKNGWLCGKYQSEWMDAVPDDVKTGIKSKEGNIEEILVPLTMDTQYNFLQKIAYDDKLSHYWWGKSKGAKPPVETVSNLNPGNVGHNLAKLCGITINRSANVIGYTWQASGINIPLEQGDKPDPGQMYVFQNLSILAKPEDRLKFPKFGFKTRPGLAYDIYGGNDKMVGNLNFAIDTRNSITGFVRQVDIMDDKKTFDLDSGMSYGTFTLGDIDALAVHPMGYLIATNWADNRMQILQLPQQAVPDAQAPAAKLVAGKGILQGLVMGPVALAISPDGKIYVLESLSNRIQAFDINGNPAPSFTGDKMFNLQNAGSIMADLDQRKTPQSLIDAFVENGAADLFVLKDLFIEQLDAGKMTMDIINAFADHMVYLAYVSGETGGIIPDPAETSFITVIKPGSSWQITDPSRRYEYALNFGPEGILVQDKFTNTEIIILAKGLSWQLKDLAGGTSFILNAKGKDLEVSHYLSYFPINQKGEQLEYCDIAIESKGYVYVLSYNKENVSGEVPNSAYLLDVYTPDGKFLFRSPDSRLTPAAEMEYIAAGRITIDLWRNLFALNYEKIAGPGGRTEPSVSQWMPSPPLFELAADKANTAMFNDKDMTKIRTLFKDHKLILSASASCSVIEKDLHWIIEDTGNTKRYDIIVNIDKIYVYNLAAS